MSISVLAIVNLTLSIAVAAVAAVPLLLGSAAAKAIQSRIEDAVLRLDYDFLRHYLSRLVEQGRPGRITERVARTLAAVIVVVAIASLVLALFIRPQDLPDLIVTVGLVLAWPILLLWGFFGRAREMFQERVFVATPWRLLLRGLFVFAITAVISIRNTDVAHDLCDCRLCVLVDLRRPSARVRPSHQLDPVANSGTPKWRRGG